MGSYFPFFDPEINRLSDASLVNNDSQQWSFNTIVFSFSFLQNEFKLRIITKVFILLKKKQLRGFTDT